MENSSGDISQDASCSGQPGTTVDKRKQGRSNRRKGGRVERELVKKHNDTGVPCKRVPLSGAAVGYKGDLKIDLFGGLIAEVKARKDGQGFATLEKWKGDHDLLLLKRNNREPMVVMDWPLYSKLISIAKREEEVDNIVLGVDTLRDVT